MWESNRTNFDRNLAVVIGIDRYDSRGIHDLQTAVSDANAIANLLRDEYGYKDEHIVRLFSPKNDEATLKTLNQPYRPATLKELRILLTDTLPNHLNPTPADRLLFYFAGHGIPRNSKDGPAGYLVPQTAEQGNPASFLPMRELHDALSKLECHHLLVILDCCFAGTFRWASSRKAIPILETVHKEHYDRFIRYPAWQVLTSAAHDQEALDLSIDQRGSAIKDTRHSPFALALIEGLRDNKADVIQDKVITAHELYLYLDRRVNELSREMQTPGIYPMRLDYDRGEYIFTRPGFKRDDLTEAPPLNEENNPYRGLKPFEQKHSRFFFGRKALVEALSHRLTQSRRPLTVVLGASGSGKSSLVKAGLLAYLREKQQKDEQAQRWYILDPMRPGKSPFRELARTLLPVANSKLIAQLDEVSFLDKTFAEILDPKSEQKQKATSPNPTQPDSREGLSGDDAFDATKLAECWNHAEPEAKLLLVVDYFAQLQRFCHQPQEQKQLSNLYGAIEQTLNRLTQALQQEPQSFTHLIAIWSQANPSTKLLLVIDQFEELITMSEDDRGSGEQSDSQVQDEQKEWQQFLSILRIALAIHDQQLHIVLTLRSDFEPRFLNSPLESHWKDARFPIRAMNSDELRQAIEGPALKQALYFEPPELVGKLIDEVGQMPGALPLLSFTLSELYIKLHDRWAKDNATDRALRIKDYEELGGVAGALTRRATQEYDNLVREFGEESGKAHQTTMRRVMLRMVVIEGGGVARRRVPESELVYPDPKENERVGQVLDRLVKARLLVKGQETGEPYVEPAHDFLVRGWDRLQEWIKEEQGNLILQQRLTPAAVDWDKNHRDDEYLWVRDPRLALLEKIFESGIDNWLNQLEVKFVEKSKQKRLDELEETKQQLKISEQRRARAEIQEKAARAENLLQVQPLNALILAIQAIGQNLEEFPENVLMPIQITLLRVMEAALVSNIIQIGVRKVFTHKGSVRSAAFSPDGKTIVSGSNDKTLRLWDLSGNPIGQPFRGHEAGVNSVAFSPDGKTIVSGSNDKTLRLWDLSGNSLGQPFRGHEDRVSSVAFSPDGKIIVSGSRDRTLRLWDLSGNPIGQPFRGHERSVNSVAFSPDGKIIVSGSDDTTSRLWDLSGNPIGQPFRGHEAGVSSVAFSPDSKIIVSGSHDKTVRLWDLSGNPIRQPFIGDTYEVRSVAFSPDGKTIVSGGWETVYLWNLNGNPIRQLLLQGHDIHINTIDINSVAFSLDGKKIVSSGGDNGVVFWWDLDGNTTTQPFQRHENEVVSIAFSPDGKKIASSSGDRTVHLCDLNGNPIGQPFRGHEGEVLRGEVWPVAFSPDGKKIASGDYDATIRLWDLNGNPIGQPFQENEDKHQVNSVTFSPDGKKIASGGYDYTVRLWDLNGNLIGQPFRGHERSVNSVAFSPDGKIIVSGSGDETVRLWDLSGNPVAQPFRGHDDKVNSVAVSPDGKTIVSGSDDKTVRLWDLSGNPIGQPFRGHERSVNSVAFSPDGKIIVSGSDDETVRLWDLNGNPIGQPFRGHEGSILCIAFSPDGKTIVSGSSDKTVRLWRGNWQTWLEACCNKLRHHPVLKNPGEGSASEAVCTTCQKYVWNPQAEQFNEQGAVKLKEKAFQTALEDFNQAVEFNPNHTNAYYNRGMCYASLKNYQEAINDFNQAIQSDKKYASAYYYRGICHFRLNKHHEAIDDFQKAAYFYENQGQRDRYQDALNYLKKLQP